MWEVGPLARRIGLSGNASRLWASLDRLERLGLARFHATDIVTVRTQLPALSERHLSRLPDQLATAYRHRRSRSVA